MCLSVPIKITKLKNDKMAEGDLNGVTVQFSVELIKNPEVDKYAIVHAGVAIEMLSEEDALETINMINEMMEDGSN